MKNSASSKSLNSTLASRRAHSSSSNDKELYKNVSGNDVQNIETFRVETEVDTSEMTEQELEYYEEKLEEKEDRRDLIAQRKDSLDLEILHLRGKHEVQDVKLRALENCKETKNSAVVQVVRRDRNRLRSRKNMSENERDACELKLAQIHRVANSELVNGLEQKTRAETPARISNQLTPVTKDLEDMGSWFNQRTSLALKPSKEEKKLIKPLHTRPGFTKDTETTPAEDDENDEWDIVDSLEISELPSTSCSLSLPLIHESVLEKTVSSFNPQKKLSGSENHSKSSDPRKRLQLAPEITVSAKQDRVSSTPSKREIKVPDRPTDPRKRPKLAIPVEQGPGRKIEDQKAKQIEVKRPEEVRKIFNIEEFLSDMPEF